MILTAYYYSIQLNLKLIILFSPSWNIYVNTYRKLNQSSKYGMVNIVMLPRISEPFTKLSMYNPEICGTITVYHSQISFQLHNFW